MAKRKVFSSHILKHAATGQWLEHWIDGWYLIENSANATTFQSADSARTVGATLEKLLGQIEVVPIYSEPQVAAG